MKYDELVKNLRSDAISINRLGSPYFSIKQADNMEAAANAIEELQSASGDDNLCKKRGCEVKDVREFKKSKWFDGACVNCGFKPALDYEFATVYDTHGEYRWNFCPNCGADMWEEQE